MCSFDHRNNHSDTNDLSSLIDQPHGSNGSWPIEYLSSHYFGRIVYRPRLATVSAF